MTVATTARTTRFCRTQLIRLRQEASPDFGAVRLHAAADSQGHPALPAPLVPTLPRPPQPGPRFERLANRPSSSGRAVSIYAAIPNFGKVEYFCAEGLTGYAVFCPTERTEDGQSEARPIAKAAR